MGDGMASLLRQRALEDRGEALLTDVSSATSSEYNRSNNSDDHSSSSAEDGFYASPHATRQDQCSGRIPPIDRVQSGVQRTEHASSTSSRGISAARRIPQP